MSDSIEKYEENNSLDRKGPLDFKLGKITRERDGLVKVGRIGFVEWDCNDRLKDIHHEPQVGFSIMVDPQRLSYTWLTTEITEISGDGYFKTKNSIYKLEW